MATKLIRVFQNIFMLNGNSSHCEQFGSKVAGVPLPTLDPASIQGQAAFVNNGWADAVSGANKQPFLEDMNALFRLAFYQLGQIFQDGIPVWDPSTPYFTGSIVRLDGTTQLYGSNVDNNIGNSLPAQTNNGFWTYLNPPAQPAGTILDFAGGAIPVGYLLCDGSAKVKATYPVLYSVLAGVGWDTFNGAAAPPADQFRVPDLRSLTTIGAGQGTGFSSRVTATLVGEETHLLVGGEMPIHSHGINDPQHAHQKQFGAPGGGDNNYSNNPAGNGAPSNTAFAFTGITINNAGGGGAHNNMQPSAVVNKIIKY
jgi:microcystin-dependent protein